MIEKVLLDYLNGALEVPVYMEESKEEKPGSYVLIEKTGSRKRNRISQATFALQSYAGSLYDAAALNEEVKAAMEDAVMLSEISRAALVSDYNFTDKEKKRYRYQAVYDITHY